MSDWWPIGIALGAFVISVVSFVCNWRHSESVFRRAEYPAVAWHRPALSKLEKNTTMSVTVCNHGPREIAAVWLGAFLSSKFKTEAWCKSDPIKSVPIGEELEIVVTQNLEGDIKERFGDLFFDESWHFRGKSKNYKAIFWFSYQPIIAETSLLMRKGYYLLKPIVENSAIISWQVVPICWLRSLLPTF